MASHWTPGTTQRNANYARLQLKKAKLERVKLSASKLLRG